MRNVKGLKVFLSAGHRGPGTGARGYFDEGLEALWLRDRLYALLEGYGVVVLRDRDDASLSEVVGMVNGSLCKEDICVDIHFNAFDGSASGVEVLVPSVCTDVEVGLGAGLAGLTSRVLGIRNRGVRSEGSGRHSRLAMLSDVRCESVVWEVCFCDNALDASRYASHKLLLAERVAGCLREFAGV